MFSVAWSFISFLPVLVTPPLDRATHLRHTSCFAIVKHHNADDGDMISVASQLISFLGLEISNRVKLLPTSYTTYHDMLAGGYFKK